MPYLVSFIRSYNDKNCESDMVGGTGQGEAQLTEFGYWAWMRLDLPQVIILVYIVQTYKIVFRTSQKTILFLYKGQSVYVWGNIVDFLCYP